MRNQPQKQLVFASHNQGKFHEMSALFHNSSYTITFLKELGIKDVAETGLSFHENALIKARHAAKATGQPAFGDDSGLCIHALDGLPGIYSARYISPETPFLEKMQAILERMHLVEDRRAFFACVIAYVQHADDQLPRFYEGLWHGQINYQIEGSMGFGYDPIFIDATTRRCVGTMSSEEKHQFSHRAQATKRFITDLTGESV